MTQMRRKLTDHNLKLTKVLEIAEKEIKIILTEFQVCKKVKGYVKNI